MRSIMRTMSDAVAKPITSGVELCRANASTVLPLDYAAEGDEMGSIGVSQLPGWESVHQSHAREAPRVTQTQPLVHEPRDHTTDAISRSTSVNPSTVSQDRTRPLLNNSGHAGDRDVE